MLLNVDMYPEDKGMFDASEVIETNVNINVMTIILAHNWHHVDHWKNLRHGVHFA